MRKLLLLLIAGPLLISCANLKVTRNDSPLAGQEPVEVQIAHIVWGFVPVKRLPSAESLCPKGSFDSLTLWRTNGDAGMTWLTLGFYVPQRATIVCGK